MNAVVLRQVVKRRGAFVLTIPHLAIPQGSIFGVMGSNGAGKTTLLSLMGLLEVPEAGSISLFGAEVASNGGKRLIQRRRIGFLTQETVLFPSLSVEENLTYGLRIRGLSVRDQESRVREVGEMLQISSLMKKRRVEGLSGGEARRIAFARVLVLPVDLYLLDEPLAGVDRESGDLIMGAIAHLARLGKTVVIVSHGEDRTVSLFSQGGVLEGGGVREQFSKGERS